MYRIALLLIPEFQLLGVVSALETLRIANSLYDGPPFSCSLVHDSEPNVLSSSGISLSTECHLKDLKDFDALIVCGSFKHHKYENAESQGLFRRFDRHGKTIGAMETGVYHVARSGVLNGYEATAHFNSLPLFSRLFPEVRFVKQIFTWSERRMTCAGGISAADLMIHLIRMQLGSAAATRVANIMVFPYLRDATEPQGDLFTSAYNELSQTVRKACNIMEETINVPVDVPAIARRLNISRRHLDRLFRSTFSCTAVDYYRMIRLSRARKLLKASTLDLVSISEACGFGSYSHFARCYKQAYAVSPSHDRRSRRLVPPEPSRLSPLEDLHPYQNLMDPQRMT